MPRPFFIADWYWFLDGDHTRAYSSAVGDFVPLNDPQLQAWMADGNVPQDATTANLGTFLANSGAQQLRPNNAAVLQAYQAGAADEVGKRLQVRIMFNHENRIRVLESRPQITFQQFIVAIRSLM